MSGHKPTWNGSWGRTPQKDGMGKTFSNRHDDFLIL
jgi:hypothetical protein